MNLSELVAYEDALVIGRLAATVTDSGIVLNGKIRSGQDREFGTRVAQLLRELATGFDDEQGSAFVADVFDGRLSQGSLGELGHVRFFPAIAGGPTLRARAL